MSLKVHNGAVLKAVWAPPEYGDAVACVLDDGSISLWEELAEGDFDMRSGFSLRGRLVFGYRVKGSLFGIYWNGNDRGSGIDIGCLVYMQQVIAGVVFRIYGDASSYILNEPPIVLYRLIDGCFSFSRFIALMFFCMSLCFLFLLLVLFI